MILFKLSRIAILQSASRKLNKKSALNQRFLQALLLRTKNHFKCQLVDPTLPKRNFWQVDVQAKSG